MHLNSQGAIYESVGKYYSFEISILGILSHCAYLRTCFHVEKDSKWKIQRLSSAPQFPTNHLYNKNRIIIFIVWNIAINVSIALFYRNVFFV